MTIHRGVKRSCKNCDVKYYDLNRDPPSCPKCGTYYIPKKTSAQKALKLHKTNSSKSKLKKKELEPDLTLWVVAVSAGTSIPYTIAGPSKLNKIKLVEPGWYFFQPNTKKIKPEQAIHLRDIPKKGLQSFLSTGIFKGIGPETAKTLIKNSSDEIYKDLFLPTQELKKKFEVSENIATALEHGWRQTENTRNFEILLRELGFSNPAIKSSAEKIGNKIIEKILANPYQLVRDVSFFNFSDAEQIVKHLNLDVSNKDRIISAMEQCLMRIEVQRGHTCAPYERALKDVKELISENSEAITTCVKDAGEHFSFFEFDKKEYIALKDSADREQQIAEKLQMMLKHNRTKDNNYETDLNDLVLPDKLKLTEEQKIALELAMSEPISLITGGPGTGKTTMVSALVEVLKSSKRKFILCAPTGRAAKRLAETGLAEADPQTIHRFLGSFKKNNEKKVDTIIIDEASMVDANIMLEVEQVLGEESNLIMIGDKDQLPPVGPGQIFKDLLETKKIPTAMLSKNLRTDKDAQGIDSLARKVIQGASPKLGEVSLGGGIDYKKAGSDKDIQDLIIEFYLQKLPQLYGFDPLKDIQILTPQAPGEVGHVALNKLIQSKFSIGKKPVLSKKYGSHGTVDLFVGDKVIQTTNDYETGVMNGDIGKIIHNNEKKITVEMSGKSIEYERNAAYGLDLAYAITIHKSQGSEYPAIIIPITSSHHYMLGRNLIYTAITRGKKSVTIVGNELAFSKGIDAIWKDLRYTLIQHLL